MQTFNLDLSKRIMPEMLFAKQRDVGSKICIKLTDNEVDYVVPDGVTWTVWYSGASGEGNYDKIDDRDAVVVNGSTATVELIYQMLNNPGPGELCIVMNSADGTQLGLWNIPYFVEAIPGADSAAAVQYYQAFLQAQVAAEEAADRAEEAADRAEAAADRAESAGGGETIIVGIDEGEHATHTATEIYNAIQNNQSVVFRYDPRLEPSEFIPLTRSTPTLAVFSKTGYPTEFDIFDITIGAHGIVHYEASFSFELVKQAVEKVETDIAPVSYLPQELNPEQQAQAQMNIGVDKLCPPFTESGSAVTCEPVEGYPLQVVSQIEPVQSGTGDPSPDNIRPISGHSAVKLTQSGKNLFDISKLISGPGQAGVDPCVKNNGNGTITVYEDEGGVSTGQILRVLAPGLRAGQTYTLSADTSGSKKFIYLSNWRNTWSFGSSTVITDDMLDSVVYWYMSENTTGIISSIQIEPGSTATAYEPYRGETFELDLGQTVYGGTLNWNTGVLTADRAIAPNGELSQRNFPDNTDFVSAYFGSIVAEKREENTEILCDKLPVVNWDVSQKPTTPYAWYARTSFGVAVPKSTIGVTAEDDNASIIQKIADYANDLDLTIVYKTAYKTTIQLTPQEILALSGINTLYSDTGDTEVTGRANPAAVISNLQSRLAALEAAVVNNA